MPPPHILACPGSLRQSESRGDAPEAHERFGENVYSVKALKSAVEH